ncbi:DUF885 domain-containing protein [Caulobacter hibisci]|uniref:DUF885 domain-containing protein n=1 Tax=Caulobacter hibisci TaxID=2035993 RepID=A0ABS0SV23_9CAUL|nr:DUF885 domain-containing protein [Caulobacter hibisci]MBI1683485.1 DUF885 domain-containing protein [Caulobacter hibisci]
MRKLMSAACVAAVLAGAMTSPVLAQAQTPAAAAAPSPAAQALKTLIDEHWAWWLKGSPLQATLLGVRTYDDQLDDPSLAFADRRAAEAAAFQKRLEAIPDAGLSQPDRVNKAILHRMLAEQVEGNGFGQRTMLFSSIGSWHQSFAALPDMLPFFTKADYDSYLTRLDLYPAYNAAAIATVRDGLNKGYVQPCAPMKAFGATITASIAKDPEASAFYKPFKAKKPSTISDADWATMQARAKAAITGKINPAYQALSDFYEKDYAPKCRTTVAASALPQGPAWYAYQVRLMTTTTRTPDEIHQLGLSEVARIRAEMDEVARKSGIAPDRKAFIDKLRTDPKYYAKTPGELMREATFLAKTIDGWMPKLFGTLPRLPYTVREIPAEIAEGNTTAYYNAGFASTGAPGVYFVNTTHLDQRPLYEMPALTVHEAVPGHHHQIALQQELDLPEFRKNAAFFTAFVEGWGLYSERLGIEMGLYDTPEKDMGRLSYEMWRACRLVVDTGIHSKGWTRDQAIAFMLENTALTRTNIEAEVDRYITWPGQALAYKLGELKIRELRARAETALGPKFDIRGFHDAVLKNGAVPLDVLEAQVDAWIAEKKAA